MTSSSLRIPRHLCMAWFKIMGANTLGTGPSILLVVNKNRYVFNCCESLEILYNEVNFGNKLNLLRGIFLTRPLWDRYASIYNYTSLRLLTEIGEKTTPNFKIYSAKSDSVSGSLIDFSEKAKYTKIDVTKFGNFYEDKEILIEPILIQKVSSGTTMAATKKTHLESTQARNEDLVVMYYGELAEILGKVDLESLEKCGIEKNSENVGELVRGNEVVLESGRIVKPEECVGPRTLGASFLIVECPNMEFLTPMLKCERLESLRTSKDRILKVVIHLVPKKVAETNEYLEWMKRFDSKTEHLIVLTDQTSRIPNHGYKMKCILNLVSQTLYPITKHEEVTIPDLSGRCENIHMVSELFHYHLHRARRKDMETQPNIEIIKYPKQLEVMKDIYTQIEDSFEVSKIRVYKKSPVNTTENTNKQLTRFTPLEHFKEFTKNTPKPELTPPKGDATVLFLGTGSTINTTNRNTSCVLIIDSQRSGYMLDCGEGAYSQLYTRFGPHTPEILAGLKVIFISHRHTDHLSGLIRLLSEREKVVGRRDNKILILGPTILHQKLKYYSNNCKNLDFSYIQHQFTEKGMDINVLKKLSLRELKVIRVKHCFDSFGVSMVHDDGWKLVYSGDTRPVDELAKVGRNCDLLIHEATMENELVDQAKYKNHSTTNEAIEIGRKMGAKFTILTHFSTRYSQLPKFEDSFVSQNVGVAFDMMTVRISDLHYLIEAQNCMREIMPKFLKHTCRDEVNWEELDSWDPYEDEDFFS